jgi:hypothetical protein
MYRLFRLFWNRRCPISLIDTHTVYERFETPGPDEVLERLPRDYVAVKLYFSACFPDTPENRRFAAQLLKGLSQASEVVLLSAGLNLDDHRDFEGVDQDRVHDIRHLVSPRNNLAVQSQIVSRASAFFGTYGGFSYLAPFYGVPSVALYSDEDKFLPVHLEVAHRACRMLKYGAFDKVKPKHRSAARFPGGTDGRSPDFLPLNVRSLRLLDLISGKVDFEETAGTRG